MIICQRSRCRQEQRDHWVFCPYCGQDGRPPAQRSATIQACDHEFFGDLPFCVRCGYSLVEGRSIASVADPQKRRLAIGLFIAGSLLIVFGLFLMWLIEGSYGPAQVLVDQFEAGKSLADPIAKHRGKSVLTPYLAVGGLVLLGFGYWNWQASKSQPED